MAQNKNKKKTAIEASWKLNGSETDTKKSVERVVVRKKSKKKEMRRYAFMYINIYLYLSILCSLSALMCV